MDQGLDQKPNTNKSVEANQVFRGGRSEEMKYRLKLID